MSDGTKIEWTEATWNPITGCSVTSPGCTNCYAMKLAGTRLRNHPSRAGLTRDSRAGPVWTGEVRFNEGWLDQPLRWKRPRMIFVCAHGDLFHEGVPDEWIDRVFAVMALCPQHTFQVLTKRSGRMREYLSKRERPHQDSLYALLHGPAMKLVEPRMQGAVDASLPLPNVWLGVSVEDQARADERIPDLLATPAAVRWLSCEPLLGAVDLGEVPADPGGSSRTLFGPLSGYCPTHFRHEGYCDCAEAQPRLHWIVAGGESGPGARPMHPDWARSLRDQCAAALVRHGHSAAAGVPFFFKQWGEYAPAPEGDISWEGHKARGASDAVFMQPGLIPMELVGKKRAGRALDGRTHDEMPA